MNKANKYIKIIKDNGLIHASSRKLSLIANSCLFLGYTTILKKKVGYSYRTIGDIGKRDQAYFLINEDRVGESFNKVVKNKNLSSIIKKMQADFILNRLLIERAAKEKDYFNTLEVVLKTFPEVLCQIGFYNSIMRYVKNNKDRARKLGELALIIGKDRDVVANLIYPVIEPLIKKCTVKIGKSFRFDGDLLRYSTLKELKGFIKTRKIPKLSELSNRRKGYLYLVSKNKEYITADRKIIDGIYREFIEVGKNVNVLRGATAYPGKVTGMVYNAFHGVKMSKPGYVLVTGITKPEDTPLLRKFAAIVTNEGGVLSHIAVVAREFKIPSVMSTKIATKVLKDGDMVEVDANKGIVKILK